MGNILLFIVVWGVYLSSCWIHIRRRELTMRMGLNFGIIHMVLVPFSVFAVQGGLAGDPGGLVPAVSWSANGRTVLKILGMVGIYGGWDLICNVLPQKPPLPSNVEPSVWDLLPKFRPIHLVAVFITVSVALFVVTGVSSGGHWADAKSEFLITLGTPALLLMAFHGAVRLAALIALAGLYMHDRVTPKWFLGWLGAICAVDLYTTGNRIFTLQVLVVIAALFLVRRQWFLLSMLGLAAIPLGVFMAMFALIRTYMHRWSGGFELGNATAALGEGYVEAKEYFLPDLGVSEFLLGISEGINVNVLIVVVEEFHRNVGMLKGTGILRGFVFWVPRSIWPGKPENLPVLIGQHLMGGEKVSMGATIFGEFWANFGFLGVFAIPVVLYLINLAFIKLIRDTTMRSIAVFLFGYTVVRMPVSDLAVLFLFVVVVLNMTHLRGKESGLAA